MNLILLGAPASGKGTQSIKIIKEFGFLHISTGDIIRSNINNQTEFGIKVKKISESGKLVPDSLIINMVSEHLKNLKSGNLIWDGFPRTIFQAESLDVILKKNNSKIDLVINFDVLETKIIERVVNRRICTKCGESYNLISNKPKTNGKCNLDNADLYIRKDDTLEKIKVRLEQYKTSTMPLINYYKKSGKLIKIDANENEETIWTKVKGLLNGNY